MTFTVLWKPTAERELTQLWLAAADRQAIAEAADRIDAELRRAADSVGESRSGDVRILIVPPLAVYFDVSPADRLATVFAVWQRTAGV